MEEKVRGPASKLDTQEASRGGGSLSHAWRALRHRNFKLFFAGQSISVIGTWMTRLATSWLVYRLTHSVLLLGLVSFAGQIVSFALGPFAGVWVERLNRRKLLVWTQAAAAVQSLAMAALTLAHVITLWEIIALAALQGLINAFDMPGRQSFLVQMVEDRNDLSNAIAINSSMANGARLIGPAIAGLVIAAVGRRLVFPDRRHQLLCRDRLFAADAHQALGYPPERDQHARTNARGLGLRPYLSSHPHDPSAVCAHQPDGLSVRRATAGLRWPGAARRRVYAWVADGSLRNRRARIGAFAGGPQVGRRTDTHASDRGRDAGRSADSVRPVAYIVAIAGADGVRRFRSDTSAHPSAIRSSSRWCRKTNAAE